MSSASSSIDHSFGLEAVLGDRMRDQVLARDLDLLVLGVAGDADDLHAVHQAAAEC